MSPDVEAFREAMLARVPDLDPDAVSIEIVGASVGPHLGPGCIGIVLLYQRGG
jgi:hypothetical protein